MERFGKDDIRIVVERALRYCELRADRETVGKTLMLVPAGAAEMRELMSEFLLSGDAEHTVFCFESAADIPDGCLHDPLFTIAAFDAPAEDTRRLAGRVMRDLSSFDRVGICAPSVAFLKRLAEGGEGRMVRAATYFLLTGKPCVVHTPYRPEHMKPGRYARTLEQLYEDLWDMGVSFSGMSPDPEEGETITDGLLTEKAIVDASRRHVSRLICGPKTVVTPLAAERAKELHIQIITRKEDH